MSSKETSLHSAPGSTYSKVRLNKGERGCPETRQGFKVLKCYNHDLYCFAFPLPN